MLVQQTDDGKKGKFFVETDGRELAEMTYVWADTELIIIDHTEVSYELNGKGVGKQLVAAGVDFARTKGIKILPLCPFAKAVMEKIAAYHDVLNEV